MEQTYQERRAADHARVSGAWDLAREQTDTSGRILDDLKRRMDLVHDAHRKLMQTVFEEGCVNDRVRAAQAEFNAECERAAMKERAP